MLEVSFEIPSATRILEGSSAIGGFLPELPVGWQSLDGLLVVGRPLDGHSKASGEIGGFPAVAGSPGGTPPVGGSV